MKNKIDDGKSYKENRYQYGGDGRGKKDVVDNIKVC